jgi:phosphoglycolate phosphatase-like HAD superfamily hydrolase
MIKAKALISDLDCTLVDTLDRFFEVFNEMLAERGKRRLSRDEFFDVYIADTLDDLIAGQSDREREKKLHGFWMEFLRRYRDGDPNGRLIPGAAETFQDLSEKGVPIAVITSCIIPAAKLRKELAALGIGKFVKAIVTAQDVVRELEAGDHFSKVEILRLAAEKLGVDPRDCVVVGDYWNDIRDGRAIGARTVAVLTGRMRRELLEKYGPDAIIETIGELPEIVEFETGVWRVSGKSRRCGAR